MPSGDPVPDSPDLPGWEQAETVLYEQALTPLLQAERRSGAKDVQTIATHMEISFTP